MSSAGIPGHHIDHADPGDGADAGWLSFPVALSESPHSVGTRGKGRCSMNCPDRCALPGHLAGEHATSLTRMAA
jgi:hypothetical protein